MMSKRRGDGPATRGKKSTKDALKNLWLSPTLAPYVTKCRHVIKNTTKAVKLLETTNFDKNCTLATLDVTSLYLKIPQEQGIQWVLDRIYNDPSPPTPPKYILRQLLIFILKDNILEFHQGIYRQKSGIAMGTRCALNFANLGKLTNGLDLLRKRYRQLPPDNQIHRHHQHRIYQFPGLNNLQRSPIQQLKHPGHRSILQTMPYPLLPSLHVKPSKTLL